MDNKPFEYWKIRTINPRFQPFVVKHLDAIKINPDVSDIEISRQLDLWTRNDTVSDDQHLADGKRSIEKLIDDEMSQILSPNHAKLQVSEKKVTRYNVNYGKHVPSRKNKQWKFDGYLDISKDNLKTLCTLYNEDEVALTSVIYNKPIDVDEEFILGNYDCRISSS